MPLWTKTSQHDKQWYEKLGAPLYSRGYNHLVNDYSLFYKKSNNSTVFVVVQWMMLSSQVLILQKQINSKGFCMTNSKLKIWEGCITSQALRFYIKGMGFWFQREFTLDLLKEFDCFHCPSSSSPLDPTVKLKAKEGYVLSDPTLYRKLVGKLNFLTNTRLDISYAVQHLSQFLQDPRKPHLLAAFHLLRYIKKGPHTWNFYV